MTKGIDKKLDNVWARIIRERAELRCEKCYRHSKYLNAHHIFGRRNKSVRWNLGNGVALCPSCHTFSSKFSAHQTPTSFTLWVVGERGQEWHDDLLELAWIPKKWTKDLKQELLEELQTMLADLTL